MWLPGVLVKKSKCAVWQYLPLLTPAVSRRHDQRAHLLVKFAPSLVTSRTLRLCSRPLRPGTDLEECRHFSVFHFAITGNTRLFSGGDLLY